MDSAILCMKCKCFFIKCAKWSFVRIEQLRGRGETMEFERRYKESLPVLAICYDFDKTLSPEDMQAQGFIQSIGYDVGAFWASTNALARAKDMDSNLAYMLQMRLESEGHFRFTRQMLMEYGAHVQLFDGVTTWFARMRAYGREHGVIVEHYVISSGLKEMIEGTAIAHEFEKIYASSFCYNDDGVAIWPAQVVNFTNKTQFLFRISKGILDINDPSVNDHFSEEEFRVPFKNLVYIGDSDTDIPCMKLVNEHKGHSICVYNPWQGDKTKVYRMMRDSRVRYFAAADYRDGSELDALVKAVISKTAVTSILDQKHFKDYHEASDA